MSNREWVNQKAWQAYFYYFRGVAFVVGYGMLAMITIIIFFYKGLCFKEPLLWAIIFWALLYITFFVYFNPYAGPVYAAELQPPIWAFFALVLSRLRSRKITLFLCVLSLILFWNNYAVIRFFRYHYGDDKQKAEISQSFLSRPSEPVFRPGGI